MFGWEDVAMIIMSILLEKLVHYAKKCLPKRFSLLQKGFNLVLMLNADITYYYYLFYPFIGYHSSSIISIPAENYSHAMFIVPNLVYHGLPFLAFFTLLFHCLISKHACRSIDGLFSWFACFECMNEVYVIHSKSSSPDLNHWRIQIGMLCCYEIFERNGRIEPQNPGGRTCENLSRFQKLSVPFYNIGKVGWTNKTKEELDEVYDRTVLNNPEIYRYLSNNCQDFVSMYLSELNIYLVPDWKWILGILTIHCALPGLDSVSFTIIITFLLLCQLYAFS
jgi:hypothetical protein